MTMNVKFLFDTFYFLLFSSIFACCKKAFLIKDALSRKSKEIMTAGRWVNNRDYIRMITKAFIV